MISKFVGNLRKFCSSGTPGGDRNKHSSMQRTTTTVKLVEDNIVSRLRMRAEKYEEKAEEATPGKSIELGRIANELRNVAINIRLKDWTDEI